MSPKLGSEERTPVRFTSIVCAIHVPDVQMINELQRATSVSINFVFGVIF